MKSTWAENVIANNTGTNISRLKLVYRQRWRLLEGFAKFTTNRLKAVRGITNDPKLIKAKVSNDQLCQMLDTRLSLVDFFIEELREIFKGSFTEVVEYLYITKSGRRDDVSNDEFLRMTVANVYKGIWAEKMKLEISEIKQITTDEKEFNTSFNAVKSLFTKTFEANKLFKRIEKCANKDAKQLMFKQIGLISQNIVDIFGVISKTKEHDLDVIFVLLNIKASFVGEVLSTIKQFNAKGVGSIDPKILNSKGTTKEDSFLEVVTILNSLIPFYNGIGGIYFKIEK
jgi:hypothetical protein